jgi:hypothetical protein
VGLITFLILGRDRAFYWPKLTVGNQLQDGVIFDNHCLAKKDEGSVRNHLRNQNGKDL